jgi:hypothetical protein
LLSFAKRKILEASVGARAAVDISAKMLDKAKDAARDAPIRLAC